jgi:hypothetical protein
VPSANTEQAFAFLLGKSSPDLRPDLAMDFYSDESSQNGHRYLVIGTLAIFRSKVPALLAKLQQARNDNNHTGELGWTSINSYKFGTYIDWLDIFAEFARPQFLRFSALVLDTSKVDHSWNDGDKELGFNKLLYQLLLHRVGARYGSERPLNGYLDHRTTVHTPETLRQILNAGLGKYRGIKTNPFQRIQFRDSKQCDLIQLTDILTGAIAFHMNGHGKKAGTRKEKIGLCQEIRNLRATDQLVQRQFDIWHFFYRERSQRA